MSTTKKLSMSIEETNKMRLSLGLKPLKGPSSSTPATTTPVPEEDIQAQINMKRKLANRKKRRLVDASEKGTKLGDSSTSSTMAWMKRINQASTKHKKRKSMAELEEEEEETVGTQGLEVLNDLSTQLENGETMVLTMDDAALIDEETGELVEGRGALSNALLLEKQEEQEQKEKNGFEDDLDEEGQVLSKYDKEDKQKERKKNRTKHVIGQGGDIDVGVSALHKSMNKHTTNAYAQMDFSSVNEYLDEADDVMNQAVKIKKKKKKKKAKKKKTKVALTMLDDETEAIQVGGDTYVDEQDADLKAALERSAQVKHKVAEYVVNVPEYGVNKDPVEHPEEEEDVGLVFSGATSFSSSVAHSKVLDVVPEKKKKKNELVQEEAEETHEESSSIPPPKTLTKPSAPVGLAATMAMLAATGELKKQREVAYGRTNDARMEDYMKGEEEGGITLEYRDKTGRLLTPKEAYREQCRTFHGMVVGKNKINKRNKDYKNELKRANKSDQ